MLPVWNLRFIELYQSTLTFMYFKCIYDNMNDLYSKYYYRVKHIPRADKKQISHNYFIMDTENTKSRYSKTLTFIATQRIQYWFFISLHVYIYSIKLAILTINTFTLQGDYIIESGAIHTPHHLYIWMLIIMPMYLMISNYLLLSIYPNVSKQMPNIKS